MFGYERDGIVVIVKLPQGLWSLSCLQTFVDSEFSDYASIEICKASGMVSLTVKVTMSRGMCKLLGIFNVYDANKGWLGPGSYSRDSPVNFAITKTLHVHLRQLNTPYNTCDGAPNMLLKVIAEKAFFGETVTIEFHHPEFKRLECDHVDELKIIIRDDIERALDNHEFPIYVVLEIVLI